MSRIGDASASIPPVARREAASRRGSHEAATQAEPRAVQDEDAAEVTAGETAPSVGRIDGLSPRRRPGDGGAAPAADVDLVDDLPPDTRRTVVAWLLDKESAATRQNRLQVLAAFLRWLRSTDPAPDLLAVTGAHLDAYCEAARAGTLTIGVRNPGKPLSRATVSRKRAVLSSLYTFAWRNGVVRHDATATEATAPPAPRPAAGARDADAVSREDRRLLRAGVARLADEGRQAEAAAVALLDGTGAPASALAGLTLQDLRAVIAGEPAIVTVHDGRGDLVAFPVPPPARPLLRVLAAARTEGEPLFRQADGRPVDARWLSAALAAAARAGGMPRERAELLDVHMMRATTVTELMREQAS